MTPAIARRVRAGEPPGERGLAPGLFVQDDDDFDIDFEDEEEDDGLQDEEDDGDDEDGERPPGWSD